MTEAPRSRLRRSGEGRIARWALLIGAWLLLLLGLAMALPGIWLAALGGSLYYALAGVAILVAGAMILRRQDSAGVGLFAFVVLATLVWSLWEIHGKGWMHSWGFDLAGRTGALLGLLIVLSIVLAANRRRGERRGGAALLFVGAPLIVLGAGVAAGIAMQEPYVLAQPSASGAVKAEGKTGTNVAALGRSAIQRDDGEWTAYAGSNLGQRFSTAAQITRDNVRRLEQVWEFNTGDEPPTDRVSYSFQNTPLKIDNSLYVCSPSNQVFALDPATGKQQWHFDPQVPAVAMEPLFSATCRAVAYHEVTAQAAQAPEAPAAPDEPAKTPAPAQAPDPQAAAGAAECPRRILLATLDSRLIALNADTGAVCESFGKGGTVDLAEGMGNQEIGFSSTTSGPIVVGDRIVVGQQVSDNQRRDAPSGVVRAYDVFTGAFVWAWDAKRIDRPQEPLKPGEIWPRGTPNVWSIISADEELGLVYLPTGNPANDHFGGNRTKEDDEYTAAVIAVDAQTGKMVWYFRTLDHDLWDYDIGAQPTVLDMDIDGTMQRVVLVGTKQGSVFVLDAATGKPLRPVERVPSPQGAMPGDWVAPTQPQSTWLPNFAARPGRDPERIDASYAFGLTPLDALYCRIQFHRMRYEGIYTPPTDQGLGMLLFPGTIGGPNWGGMSVNPDTQILVTNHSRLPNRVQLIPRDRVDDVPIGDGGARPDQDVAPQAGSPYGVVRPMWLSPLGVPCISPPWGYIAATDLRTGNLLWARPLGTGYDVGPMGIGTRLKLTIGTANIGGAVSTRGGLTFIAAAQDNFLRAFDTATGELLWDGRMPASGQAGPITYVHEGRQYVAIAAGGHTQLETVLGDSVVVFALPDGKAD